MYETRDDHVVMEIHSPSKRPRRRSRSASLPKIIAGARRSSPLRPPQQQQPQLNPTYISPTNRKQRPNEEDNVNNDNSSSHSGHSPLSNIAGAIKSKVMGINLESLVGSPKRKKEKLQLKQLQKQQQLAEEIGQDRPQRIEDTSSTGTNSTNTSSSSSCTSPPEARKQQRESSDRRERSSSRSSRSSGRRGSSSSNGSSSSSSKHRRRRTESPSKTQHHQQQDERKQQQQHERKQQQQQPRHQRPKEERPLSPQRRRRSNPSSSSPTKSGASSSSPSRRQRQQQQQQRQQQPQEERHRQQRSEKSSSAPRPPPDCPDLTQSPSLRQQQQRQQQQQELKCTETSSASALRQRRSTSCSDLSQSPSRKQQQQQRRLERSASAPRPSSSSACATSPPSPPERHSTQSPPRQQQQQQPQQQEDGSEISPPPSPPSRLARSANPARSPRPRPRPRPRPMSPQRRSAHRSISPRRRAVGTMSPLSPRRRIGCLSSSSTTGGTGIPRLGHIIYEGFVRPLDDDNDNDRSTSRRRMRKVSEFGKPSKSVTMGEVEVVEQCWEFDPEDPVCEDEDAALRVRLAALQNRIDTVQRMRRDELELVEQAKRRTRQQIRQEYGYDPNKHGKVLDRDIERKQKIIDQADTLIKMLVEDNERLVESNEALNEKCQALRLEHREARFGHKAVSRLKASNHWWTQQEEQVAARVDTFREACLERQEYGDTERVIGQSYAKTLERICVLSDEHCTDPDLTRTVRETVQRCLETTRVPEAPLEESGTSAATDDDEA